MRTLFAIKTLVNSVGGAERLVVSLCNALAACQRQHNIHIDLLTLDPPNASPFYPVHENAVTRHCVPVRNTAGKTSIFEYPMLLLRLRCQVIEMKPDIVVAFMHSMFVPLQCALLGTGIKVVLSEHTVPKYYQGRRLEFLLLQFFSLFAASITIISERVKAMYPFIMRRKMAVLPNIIDTDFLPAYNQEEKIILGAGRLIADKDYVILIKAFSLLSKDFPDWRLVIVGEGEDRIRLEAMVSRLGLQDSVSLPGAKKDMNAVYRNAKFFVHPSRYENYGMVIVEAMSHSLPVVGFADCPGTNEIVCDGQNGILVAHRKAECLAAAMRLLMDNPAQINVYGARAGIFVKEELSQDTVVSKWVDFLFDVANQK